MQKHDFTVSLVHSFLTFYLLPALFIIILLMLFFIIIEKIFYYLKKYSIFFIPQNFSRYHHGC